MEISSPFRIDLNQYPQASIDESLHSPSPPIDLNEYPQDMSSPENSYEHVPPADNIMRSTKKKNLDTNKKVAIMQMLSENIRDGKLQLGAINKVAEHFSLCRKTVSRIWRDTKNYLTSGNLQNLSSKMVKKVGRKRVEVDVEAMKAIPFRRRTNIRSLSNALGLAKSTVHRRIKEKSIRPHSNAIKPFLLDGNKKSRLEFCLSMVKEGTLGSNCFFIDMYDRIHIDEKWFFLSNTTQKIYLHPDEIEPSRTCKSKRFIEKVMFLAAVARPRFDATNNLEFDGKIGIWPLVIEEPAKRSSRNRVAGTMEVKPILSVNKDVMRYFFIECVLPSIKEKWPSGNHGPIFIQQDNAKPHLDVNDSKFLEAVEKCGLDIRLYSQPPNSPDLNVLDLGFFRAIDSLQHQEAPTTVVELISAVKNAFDIFPKENLNKVFLTLQTCMIEILKKFGGNNYKIPHMNKNRLIRDGQLPICIECDSQVLEDAKLVISEM